jgi:N-acetylglutamate synthase/N-acetylornithine aminotransferase
VRLYSWETISGEAPILMAKTGIDREVNLYQAAGTIVPVQDTKRTPVRRIEELSKLPVTLSINLDQTGQASGTLFAEDLLNEYISYNL